MGNLTAVGKTYVGSAVRLAAAGRTGSLLHCTAAAALPLHKSPVDNTNAFFYYYCTLIYCGG